MTTCNDGAQDASWCPSTTDDTLPSVLGLLPSGPAWDAAQQPGTVMNKFWRAFASPLTYAHMRACALVDEFFCATVNESYDTWVEEYALGGECDPYANNLCAKVSAIGGATCDYFVDVALRCGWVIQCEEIPNVIPSVGCIRPGFVQLNVSASPRIQGSNLGVGEMCVCDYGPAVKHPEPAFWESRQLEAQCKVPGSSLGISAMGPDCCNFVGFYEVQETEAAARGNSACAEWDYLYTVDCPHVSVPSLTAPTCPADEPFFPYMGSAHHWKITVDLAASTNELKNSDVWKEVEFSQSGCMHVGCTPVGSGPTFSPLLCFLEDLKPAHTKIVYEVQ